MQDLQLHPGPSRLDVADAAPLRSELSRDPDLAELLDLFVHDLPDRIADFQAAARQEDLAHLARLARQVRAAARGYGFPAMTEPAARIESLARDPALSTHIGEAIDELLSLMRRASRVTRE